MKTLSKFSPLLLVLIILVAQPPASGMDLVFLRGDSNADGTRDISDASFLLGCLFLGGKCPPCAKAADANDDSVVNMSDSLFLLNFLFQGGPRPPAPNRCGTDPTPDRLSCHSYRPCFIQAALKFAWPMPGTDARDWVINNYVDLQSGTGKRDFMGNTGDDAKTYDGHRGIDIDVPTFRAMDGDFPILAAAPGRVVATDDSHFDRNMSCTGDWNFVTIEHANGTRSIYGHLKQGSVVVSVGQNVQAGDKLGVVGSSGCSTAPHLHFEVRDDENKVVDPFLDEMWLDPPVYDTPLGFMDASLRRGAISSVNQIKDPPPNVTTMYPGETLGIGLSMAGGAPGQAFQIIIRDGNGDLFETITKNFNFVGRHTFWYWNREITDVTGTWTVQIRTNGIHAKTYEIEVCYAPGTWFTRHNIPAGDYQGVFDGFVDKQFRPVWLDGFNVNGNVYFNAIFEKNDAGIPWTAHHGLTGAQYQAVFNTRMSEGYRLLNVDSYRNGNSSRYAAIFVKQNGTAQAAYHGLTAAQHQIQFGTLARQGFRAVNISVVSINGTEYFTAFYDKANVGGWVALAGLTSSQYQAEFNTQTQAGRRLQYLNGYNDNGVAKFSAIWNSVPVNSWVARHNLNSADYQSQFNNWVSQGMRLQFVTGYQNGRVANFGAFWSK